MIFFREFAEFSSSWQTDSHFQEELCEKCTVFLRGRYERHEMLARKQKAESRKQKAESRKPD